MRGHQLEQLRRDAKRLVKAVDARDPVALARIVTHHPRFKSAASIGRSQLADAQLVIAREQGHVSWADLKRDLERRQFLASAREERVRELIDAICGRGWDAPPTANLERAEEYLKADAALCSDDFVLACATGELAAVKYRLDEDPGLVTRELGPRGWQPLVYVAYSILSKRHDARAERITQVGALLLERGASANSGYAARTGTEETPHKFAVLFACIHVSDNLSLAQRLLEAGADPNDSDSLYHAVERFNTDALELLYGYGLKSEWLSYCMLHQIDLGFVPGVRWFLDHGAEPNVRHPCGLTALHWAIQRPGNDRMVELLLERGADAQAKTPAGLTALDLAERRHGKVEVVSALERHGARRGERTPLDELVVAAAYGDEQRARALLDGHPGLLSQLRHDDRCLVSAFAEAGNRQGALILARLGFDMAAPSWMGMTALHWAACRGNPQMLRDLLAAGAPFLDAHGFGTPLHSALYQRWSSFGYRPGEGDYAGVLRVLLEAGMDVPDELRPSGDAELDALIAAHMAASSEGPGELANDA
jgi:ankyrin repeat protein